MFTITVTLNVGSGEHLDVNRVMDRVIAPLNGLEARIKDISPAAPAVFGAFREIVAAAFASEGASTDGRAGQPWLPLLLSTRRDREGSGIDPFHPILERTGKLRRSLTERTGDTVEIITPGYLALGSSVHYGKYHQSRMTRKNVPLARTGDAHASPDLIPRRAFVALTSDQKNDLFRPLRRHITGRDPNAPVRGRIE